MAIQHRWEKIRSKKMRKDAMKTTNNEEEASIADNSTIASAKVLGYNLRNAPQIEIDQDINIEFDGINFDGDKSDKDEETEYDPNSITSTQNSTLKIAQEAGIGIFNLPRSKTPRYSKNLLTMQSRKQGKICASKCNNLVTVDSSKEVSPIDNIKDILPYLGVSQESILHNIPSKKTLIVLSTRKIKIREDGHILYKLQNCVSQLFQKWHAPALVMKC